MGWVAIILSSVYGLGVFCMFFASVLEGYKPTAWILRGLGWPLMLGRELAKQQREGHPWP